MFLSTGCHFLLMFQIIFVSISFNYKPFIILEFFLLEVKIFILLDIRNYGDVLISTIISSRISFHMFSFPMHIPVPVPVPVPIEVFPFRILFRVPGFPDDPQNRALSVTQDFQNIESMTRY